MSLNTLQGVAQGVKIRNGAQSSFPAVGGTADVEFPIYFDARKNDFDGAAIVAKVTWVPSQSIAVAATAPTLTVNKRTAGGSAVAVASWDITGTGNDVTAYKPVTMTLNGTASHLKLAPGDVLTFQVAHNSTGTALTASSVFVDIASP